jgi:hypothetical protein
VGKKMNMERRGEKKRKKEKIRERGARLGSLPFQ